MCGDLLSVYIDAIAGNASDTATFLSNYSHGIARVSQILPLPMVERMSSPEKNLSAAIKNRTLYFQCFAKFR